MKLFASLMFFGGLCTAQVTVSVPVTVHADAVNAILAYSLVQSCSVDGPIPNGITPHASLITGAGEVCYSVTGFGATFGVAVSGTVVPAEPYAVQAYFYHSVTGHLYRSTGTGWEDLGIPADGIRMINMSNGAIYRFTAGKPVLVNGAAVVLARERLRVAAQAATRSLVNSAVVWALTNNPSLLPAALATTNTTIAEAEAAKAVLIETLSTTDTEP